MSRELTRVGLTRRQRSLEHSLALDIKKYAPYADRIDALDGNVLIAGEGNGEGGRQLSLPWTQKALDIFCVDKRSIARISLLRKSSTPLGSVKMDILSN